MKERPILFNAEMVKAILSGRKTQTRRIIQERHLYSGGREAGNWPVHMPEGEEGEKARLWAANNSPFGAVGDRLWVRETWSDVNNAGCPSVAYRADGEVRDLGEEDGEEADPNLEKYWFATWYPDLINGTEGRWRPSIHMPRWASRIDLLITGVRVERLNDISVGDVMREGCSAADTKSGYRVADVFVQLWGSIYGEGSWQANPWVWVIEFERVAQAGERS